MGVITLLNIPAARVEPVIGKVLLLGLEALLFDCEISGLVLLLIVAGRIEQG